MSDLISRQDVLDLITASINQFGGRYTSEQLNMWGLFTQMIQELPSAQKKGEWIKIDKYDKESNVQCSVCLEDFDYIDGVCYLCHGYELPLFCPNCGADMRGDKE